VNTQDSIQNEGHRQPVYEFTTENATGQRLVLTTWMLLDELTQCQEEIEQLLTYVHDTGVGKQRILGCPYNPLTLRLERAHFSVSHILRLLCRSGLWTDETLSERTDTEANAYSVIEQPFSQDSPEKTARKPEFHDTEPAQGTESQSSALTESRAFVDRIRAAINPTP
jgi:hypothetical protein